MQANEVETRRSVGNGERLTPFDTTNEHDPFSKACRSLDMPVSDNFFPVDGARERFAQLHFQAACVRLEGLARLLKAIEESGGIERVPMSLVGEAMGAATDVAENLRWSYERIAETGRRRAEEGSKENGKSPLGEHVRPVDAPRPVRGEKGRQDEGS
jgi:hypothetical protein